MPRSFTGFSAGRALGVGERRIVDRCLSRAEPGAIYIFHVGIESQDAQALTPIIAGLRERGYIFVTVTDLLGL